MSHTMDTGKSRLIRQTIRSNADPTLSGELQGRVKMRDLIRPVHVGAWNASGGMQL